MHENKHNYVNLRNHYTHFKKVWKVSGLKLSIKYVGITHICL